nr:radical SAM protein [Candidatus Sigynarchaeota archaeon]
MYKVDAERVYVLDRVRRDPRAEKRLARMLAAIHPKEIIDIDDQQLNRMVIEHGWTGGHEQRTGAYHREGSPVLVFSTFRWDNKELARVKKQYPALDSCLLLGQNPVTTRSRFNQHGPDWCVCQLAKEIHSIYGCLHACDYCHVEDFVNIMLDLERLVDFVAKVIKATPDQHLYKYDNYTDQICFEPEYGASELLVPFFGTQDDKYILLYTKSDNVDHLLDLDHRGKTIINWSLSPRTQSTKIEKGTPPFQRRIAAMQKCQDAGYTVRVRVSPIIPVENWQDEYTEMIDLLLASIKPDVITLDVVGFMSPSQMKVALDTSLFDKYARALLDQQERLERPSWGKHVFPDEYRKELYEHVIGEIRKRVPGQIVSICNETFDMWEIMAPALGANSNPDEFTCCCGPNSVPGHHLLKG